MTSTPETRVVPVEPTKDMIVAIRDGCPHFIMADTARLIYRNVLAAAPAAPAPEPVAIVSGSGPQTSDLLWVKSGSKLDLPDGTLLYAAPPAPVAAPAVRKLVWREWGQAGAGTVISQTSIGPYFVSYATGELSWTGPDGVRHFEETYSEAKAAAQSDYDRRVRACLETGKGWRGVSSAAEGIEALITGYQYNDPTRGRYYAVATHLNGYWYDDDDNGADLHAPTHYLLLSDLPPPPEAEGQA